MTTHTNTTSSNRPAFRLCFAAQTGVQRDGRAELSYPVEIGACFTRKDPSKGLVARFHFIPDQIRDGVLFLMPVTEAKAESGDLFANAEAGQ